VFLALAGAGRADRILDRLAPWHESLAAGLRTVPEEPQPSRSDCHGWAAHPRFHAVAAWAGLRPADAGGRRITVDPDPGTLPGLAVALPLVGGGILHLDLGPADGDGGRECRLTVPAGAEALCGPGLGGARLGSGAHALRWRPPG
jgi:hypothetical protein